MYPEPKTDSGIFVLRPQYKNPLFNPKANELRDYLPGHNARCTIYQWIRYDGFPYYQNAKSYYFRRSEVDDWLIRNGRKR